MIHRVLFSVEHRFEGLELSYRIVRFNRTLGKDGVSPAPSQAVQFESLAQLRDALTDAGLGHVIHEPNAIEGVHEMTPRQLEWLGFTKAM